MAEAVNEAADRQAAGQAAVAGACHGDRRGGDVGLRPAGRLFGALKHDGPPVALEDMERAIAEGACEE